MKLAIRQVREKRGWTQKYVADKTGITQAMLQKIETGKRKPSYDVLVKLEDLFHMSHRKLFGAATPDNTKRPDGNQAES
jgi:transcriptional regulator with XRE-family HTH domain